MNAITPHAGGRPPLDAQVLAIQNGDILAAIADNPEPFAATRKAIADATGRDPSNLKKTLAILEREGLVVVTTNPDAVLLTRQGGDLRGRLAILAGDAPLATDAADEDAITLTADRLAPDPANPRRRSGLTDGAIEEMALSIAQEFAVTGRGLITPPTVRPPLTDEGPWRINKGARRWRGWTLAIARGWIPADHAVRCPIYRGTDIEALASALVENLQRSDLDNLEEAESFAALEAAGDTVARICERIGKTGSGGERYVQERLRVARLATAADKARYVASCAARDSGEDDASPYLWKDLRDSVKIPRHVTALDRNPRLRLLVLEMAALNDSTGDVWDAELRTTRDAPGGLLDMALELGLVHANPWGTAHLSETACAWLAQQGFGEDAETAQGLVHAACVEVLTDIGAASLPPGQWATDFLNTPAPEPGSDHAAGTLADGMAPPDVGEPGEASGPASPEPLSEDDDAEEIPAFLRRLAGTPVSAPTIANPPPKGDPSGPRSERDHAEHGGEGDAALAGKPVGPAPTDAERLILAEVAWAIQTGGVEPEPPGWARGVTVHGFQEDRRAVAMIPRWLTMMAARDTAGLTITITSEGRTFLDSYYEGGLTPKDIDAARYAGGSLAFNTVVSLRTTGRFATPWLNPPAAAPADHADTAAITNLNPVTLMRAALVQLWTAAGDHYATRAAVMAATGASERAAEEDARLAATALTLQHALAAAAPFIPAEVKAAHAAGPEAAHG